MSARKFLVVDDDSPEAETALRFACRRARSTGGRVAILRVIEPAVFEHWSGVREEMERQAREEAEAVLQAKAALVQEVTGFPPEFVIKHADSMRAGLRAAIAEDEDIKVLVLAAAGGGRGPGPLISSLAKEGATWGGRKIPVTVVPGDLTDEEIAGLG